MSESRYARAMVRAFVLAIVCLFAACDRAAPAPAPTPTDRPTPIAAPATAPRALHLDTIADPDERAAVARVVDAIDRGARTRYRKDGTTFGNREHRLPPQPDGYYREYTVPTPDAGDRGARRIVAGDRDELYYTRDHYRSFARIRDPS